MLFIGWKYRAGNSPGFCRPYDAKLPFLLLTAHGTAALARGVSGQLHHEVKKPAFCVESNARVCTVDNIEIVQ